LEPLHARGGGGGLGDDSRAAFLLPAAALRPLIEQAIQRAASVQ